MAMSPEEKALRLRYKNDFPFFAEKALRIRTKAGETLSLRLNSIQTYIHGRLEEQRKQTGKVRCLVLKGRQGGVSTYTVGRHYWQVSHRKGCQAFILTHEQPATDNLFGMVERFHRNNKPGLRPETGAANAKELVFPGLDSGYSVGTAGSKAVGRSKTIQLFHGSEVAFWPNAGEHFAGVGQAVPDMPGTEIVLESTANGIGGEFHERWQMAEAGDGDYLPIFVPWFWTDEYQRVPPVGFSLNEEEEECAKLYGLSLPQMVWRRAKMAELKDPALFKQEYPATAAEAFQATGHDAFIPSQLVLSARKRDCEAIGSLILGVDPARFGDDSFAIACRQGRKVHFVNRRHKIDTVAGANWVRQEIDRLKPTKVFVDVGGLGAGIVDMLRDWGDPYDQLVEGVNFGGAAQEPIKHAPSGDVVPSARNRRAEMWMRSRDWLADEGGADIPDDDALHADACAPSYKYDARQFLVLEAKEEIRKRGLRSPDGWDAVALTFAAPVRPGPAAGLLIRERYAKRKFRRSLWGG